MFNADNTSGFTGPDLDLMNRALRLLIEDGIDESNASSIVSNNWQESGNTVASLATVRTPHLRMPGQAPKPVGRPTVPRHVYGHDPGPGF